MIALSIALVAVAFLARMSFVDWLDANKPRTPTVGEETATNLDARIAAVEHRVEKLEGAQIFMRDR